MNMKSFLIQTTCILACLLTIAGCRKGPDRDLEGTIFVNHTLLNMFVGDVVQLTASPTDYSFSWVSQNPDVATVSQTGEVRAVNAGEAKIVVSSNDVSQEVRVIAVTPIPMTGFSLSCGNAVELQVQEKLQVNITIEPSNVNMPFGTAVWSSKNVKIATFDDDGKIVAAGVGNTEITCTIGTIIKTVAVNVWYTKPFMGPHIFSAAEPYTLNAWKFDIGGPGKSYYDSNNNGAIRSGHSLRADDPYFTSPYVDLESGGNIGYIVANEWVLFTVEVQDAGVYQADVDAAGSGETKYHLKIDGVDATGPQYIPSTGGWGNYEWIEGPEVTLTKGKHTVTFFFETANANLRNLRFTSIP
jgi:hypothetical protein